MEMPFHTTSRLANRESLLIHLSSSYSNPHFLHLSCINVFTLSAPFLENAIHHRSSHYFLRLHLSKTNGSSTVCTSNPEPRLRYVARPGLLFRRPKPLGSNGTTT
jgi:hypothetical protein